MSIHPRRDNLTAPTATAARPKPADRAHLRPYEDAAARHGDGFGSLLWASPATQAARFDALTRVVDLRGADVLDAGCGRADLLPFLLDRGIVPASYVGLEAVDTLAAAAGRAALLARRAGCRATIHLGDFLADPSRLHTGASVILFSGSLNTLRAADFYRTLELACRATRSHVAFNFLDSPRLAGAPWLTWHDPARVLGFCRQLATDVTCLDDYLPGDSTIAMRAA